MKKAVLITTLAVALFTSSIGVNAQAESVDISKAEFKVDHEFMEIFQTDQEQIYEKYSNVADIQEIQLSDSQISKCVEAYQDNGDGIRREVDCDVKLNKVVFQQEAGLCSLAEEDAPVLYVLSATASSKESDSSTTKNGVTLYGCIGWTDNFGPNNKFEYVKGSRSGSYSGKGRYDALNGTTNLCGGDFDSSFYSTSTSNHTTGYSFRLNIQSGTGFNLNFTTSVLD